MEKIMLNLSEFRLNASLREKCWQNILNMGFQNHCRVFSGLFLISIVKIG